MSSGKTYKIGITGNIGSGKSTVCRIFEVLNIPVYYSDSEAKRLINSSPEIISVYKRVCGASIYVNNQLDSSKAANILFKDKNLLNEVEQVVHPAVQHDFEKWADAQQAPFVLQESALLFENGRNHFFDRIIFVSAPKPLRIERIMKRNGWSQQNIRNRISHQWNEEIKIPLSDFTVVCNNVQPVIPQVLELYRQLNNELKTY